MGKGVNGTLSCAALGLNIAESTIPRVGTFLAVL
jgi:hypothetical protein